MEPIVRLYSNQNGEITRFLKKLYQKDFFENKEDLFWQYNYENPIEIADIIGAWIENNDDYKINMWVSLDPQLFINVTEHNADEIIRYLFERYPY